MTYGDGFRELGNLIDRLESHELTVTDIRPSGDTLLGERGVAVEVTASLKFLQTVTEGVEDGIGAEITGDLPTCTFEVEIPGRQPAGGSRERPPEYQNANICGQATDSECPMGPEVAAESESVAATAVEMSTESLEVPADTGRDQHANTATADGGTSLVDSTAGARPDDGGESASDSTADADEIPYHKNEALLAEVYEEHDTFAEMTEALGVNVTPATVRHHMVNHGIHPNSSTDSETDGEENEAAVNPEGAEGTEDVNPSEAADRFEPAKADDIDLPDGVSLEELVDTVVDSRTFYEAQSQLGIDAERTRSLLAKLDCLDLITTRLATAEEMEVTAEDVYERIYSP